MEIKSGAVAVEQLADRLIPTPQGPRFESGNRQLE